MTPNDKITKTIEALRGCAAADATRELLTDASLTMDDLLQVRRRLARAIVTMGGRLSEAAERWNESRTQVSKGDPVDALLAEIDAADDDVGARAALNRFAEAMRLNGAIGAVTGMSGALRECVEDEALDVQDLYRFATDELAWTGEDAIESVPERTMEERLRKMEAQRNAARQRANELAATSGELKPILEACYQEIRGRALHKARLRPLVRQLTLVLGKGGDA